MIDDMPLDIQIESAPPNIMFTIDDSGSMDWEVMTQSGGQEEGDTQGKLIAPNGELVGYLYNGRDNHYTGNDDNGNVLGVTTGTRADHRATWSGYNKLYYDPGTDYKPWPAPDGDGETRLPAADPDHPRLNPTVFVTGGANQPDHIDNAFDLNGIYHTFGVPVNAIVVDDGDWNRDPPGFVITKGDGGYEERGDWSDSNGSHYYGTSKTRYTKKTSDSVVWSRSFANNEKGVYEVLGWWSCWETRDINARLTVNTGAPVLVDQSDGTGSCGQWVSLGRYDVDQGWNRVTLDRVDKDGQEPSTAADAVWFVDPADLALVGRTYEETGDWSLSDRPRANRGAYGDRRADARKSSETGASVTWRHCFTREDEGEYVVQGYWPCSTNADQHARFTVVHTGGTAEMEVDQREGTGRCGETAGEKQWVTLGTFSFKKGECGAVSVSRTEEGNGAYTLADAVRFVKADEFAAAASIDSIPIINAHYYQASGDGSLYLVELTDPVKYYRLSDGHGAILAPGDLEPVGHPPADVRVADRTAARQNFANWFTYHRRRYLISIAAISEVISRLNNVYIGLAGINALQEAAAEGEGIIEPCLPVGVDGEDYTEILLTALYGFDHLKSGSSTPMRNAMVEIGEYFNRSRKTDLKRPPGPLNDGDRGQGSQDKFRWEGWFDLPRNRAKYRNRFDGVDSTEPINGPEAPCGQNFVILFTDGYYNGGAPGGAIGNTDGKRFETDEGIVISGVPPFSDTGSGMLADVTMYYYAMDLDDDAADLVPKRFPDSAAHQHLVSYVITFGVVGTLDPDDYEPFGDDPALYPPWTGKNNRYDLKIDDMYHAAVNGRGEFVSARSPGELVEAFSEVVRTIMDQVSVGASASVSSQELLSGSQLFISGYNTNGWAGVVTAYDIDPADGTLSEGPAWNAGGKRYDPALPDSPTNHPSWRNSLETLVGADGSGHVDRNIATWSGSGGRAFRGDLTPELTADRVDYLRGDKRLERRNGGPFRNRLTVWEGDRKPSSYTLGDIVHSSPVFHGGVVYVGANDGMLHAFLADGSDAAGTELFAYIPGLVLDRLPALTGTGYGHQYYVDGTPMIRDIEDMTLLVGGLGKGGKGYYALDISKPGTVSSDSDAAGRAVWEFADIDMGYSFGRPVITRIDSTDNPYVVVFGNGYGGTAGTAVLYILGTGGDLIKKFDTGAAGTAGCNGMSSPFPADIDNDGKTEFIYAGDLAGNLWKFDISASRVSDWSGARLFTAADASGNPRPITARPDVTGHCSGVGRIVIFGTGRFLGTPDLDDAATQALYGIWDFGEQGDATERWSTHHLLEQTAVAASMDGEGVRILTDKAPDWSLTADDDPPNDFDDPDMSTAHSGWYFELPLEKERITQDIRIRSGKAIVVSHLPVAGGGVCTAGGGASYLHAVAPCNGGLVEEAVIDVNDDGEIDGGDTVSADVDGETKRVPISGLRKRGLLFGPGIAGGGELDYLYMPLDPLHPGRRIATRGADVGMTFWRQRLE